MSRYASEPMDAVIADTLIGYKNRYITEGRLLLNTHRHDEAVEMLLVAAWIEEVLAQLVEPNGKPSKEDHLRSAESCRALAKPYLRDPQIAEVKDVVAAEPPGCRAAAGTHGRDECGEALPCSIHGTRYQ